jgi:hypothetical protein
MMGVLGFDFWRGLGIFLFTTVSRTALGPTQPPIQWVPQALSLGIKRSGREADASPPSSAEVKNAWSYVSSHQYVFMEWCLVKHRDNFTFTPFVRFTAADRFVLIKLGTDSRANALGNKNVSPCQNQILAEAFPSFSGCVIISCHDVLVTLVSYS